MASDAPLAWLVTKDAPASAAARTPANPMEVNATAVLEPVARTRALADAPTSSSATMACTASAAGLNTAGKKDLIRHGDVEIDAYAQPELE
jgi:hypothetical protein